MCIVASKLCSLYMHVGWFVTNRNICNCPFSKTPKFSRMFPKSSKKTSISIKILQYTRIYIRTYIKYGNIFQTCWFKWLLMMMKQSLYNHYLKVCRGQFHRYNGHCACNEVESSCLLFCENSKNTLHTCCFFKQKCKLIHEMVLSHSQVNHHF